MAVIVVAVLLVSLGIANTVSGASLTSRQTPDPCMDQLQAVQPQCIQALVTLSQIGNLTQPGNDPDRLRAVFEPPLMVFCASDCLGPVLDLVQCQVRDENATNFVSTLVRLICSNDGGTYCLLKVLSDLVNFSQLDCGRTGTCNSTCQAVHEQVRDDLGAVLLPGSSKDHSLHFLEPPSLTAGCHWENSALCHHLQSECSLCT